MDRQNRSAATGSLHSTMFHGIITFLTTLAVMLHALLGCCAHHAHACDGHQHDVGIVADEAEHGHSHHDHSHHHSTADDCSDDDEDRDEHHGDDEPCDEADCSFVSIERSDDANVILSLTLSLPVHGDTADATTLRDSLSRRFGTKTPPGHLLSPESLRAQTQVWLL